MQRVLVSACLLGSPVRYNGDHKQSDSAILQRWLAEGRVVSVCPELAGGLPVPRPPAEIVATAGAHDVILGLGSVRDINGQDVSAAFVSGAEQTLQQALRHAVKVAVLKEGSPSCGSGYVYDGSFSGNRVAGQGVATTLLQQAGIRVFSEHEFAKADALLRLLEASATTDASEIA